MIKEGPRLCEEEYFLFMNGEFISHIGCELFSPVFVCDKEDLTGVFQGLGEVSLCDPIVRRAEISSVLFVMCVLVYSFPHVCKRRICVIRV